jgi:hypothetical protein
MDSCHLNKRSVKNGIVRCRLWLVWRESCSFTPNSPFSKIITYTNIYIHIYIHKYIHIHTCTHTFVYTHIYPYIHSYTHTYTLTHTHSHTNTHCEKLCETFPFFVESTWRRMCLKHDRVASAENRSVLSITRDISIPVSQRTRSPTPPPVQRHSAIAVRKINLICCKNPAVWQCTVWKMCRSLFVFKEVVTIIL